MALKKYTRLLPNDWAVLEQISHFETLKSSRMRLPEPKEVINFVVIDRDGAGKMHRNFCKCGYVSNEDGLEACPVCGNKNRIYIRPRVNCYSGDVIAEDLKVELSSSNNVECSKRSVSIKEAADEYELSITSFITEFVFEENEVLTSSGSYIGRVTDYDYEKILSLYPYDKESLKYWEIQRGQGALNFVSYLEAKKKYPRLIKDLETHPRAVAIACYSPYPGMDFTTSLEDLYSEGFGCPDKSFYPYMKKLLAKCSFTSFSSWRATDLNIFYGYNSFVPALQNTIKYLVGHSKFTGTDIRGMLRTISSASYSPEMQEILAKFILANHITEGTSVLSTFTYQVNFLKSNGYEVSEEMMDKKNFNSIRNLDYIEKSGGYNKKRAKLFFDAFDVDPLGSLKYLSSKKVPNRKEMETVEEAINKKYS